MNKPKNRRKKIFASKLQQHTVALVFFAAFLPAAIVAFCLYYLIFGVIAAQFTIPEVIAYNIVPAAKKVTAILLVAAPATIAIILFFTYKITHTIVGPLNRITRELNEHVEGRRRGHICVRETDKFWPLVEKINKLLDKFEK